MEIKESARKHVITDDEITHAFENAIRFIEYEHQGEDRLLVIGSDVLHAKFYDYLR